MKNIIAKIDSHNSVIVTKHAQMRGKKRLNIRSKNLVNLAKRAYTDGLDYFDTVSKHERNVKLTKDGLTANNIKIYGHGIFVMNNNILLTVINLPEHLWVCWDNRARVSAVC